MSRGLRTLLRTLTGRPDSPPTTTFVAPSRPSTPPYYPPPRVQPILPSTPIFHGRDTFTTEQLVRHRLRKLDFSRREIDPDPRYPDVSHHAGNWSASIPPFDWDCDKARLCDKWRHRIENPIEDVTREDMEREKRMERRVVRSLEPEFTRAVDKEDFRRRMWVQFEWAEDGAELLVPHDRRSGLGCRRPEFDSEEPSRSLEREERSSAEKPSIFLRPESEPSPLQESIAEGGMSSFESIRKDHVAELEQHRLRHSLHHKEQKVRRRQTLPGSYHDDAVEDDVTGLDATRMLDPFEDTTYALSDHSSSSAYSVRPSRISPFESEEDTLEVHGSRMTERVGPSLDVPFSWPEVSPNSWSRPPVPPLHLSQDSFLDITKDMPVHLAPWKKLSRAVTAPQQEEGEDVYAEDESFEELEKRRTLSHSAARGRISLEGELRASKVRREKADREEAAKKEVSKSRKGTWLKRLW